MNRSAILAIVALLATALLAAPGCDNMSQPATGTDSGTTTHAAAKPAAKTGTTLATVGDSRITVEEFESKMEKIPPFYKKKMATLEGKKDFIERMIMEELYYQEALKRGLQNDPEFLEQMESIERNLLANKIKRQILEEDVTPTEDEIAAYYEANKEDKFKVDESLKLKHILIRVSRKATDEDIAKAETKAKKALAALKSGKPFEEVAKEFSEDKYSAKKGGEIPAVRKGVKSKEFEAEAWKLTKPGEISGIFRDRRGFNIVQFVEKIPASYREFDKVEAQIKRSLENEKRRDMLETFNNNLKNGAEIEIKEDLLAESGPQVEEPAAPNSDDSTED